MRKRKIQINLHSNMVRFIIYIREESKRLKEDLHSNMVRFIIVNDFSIKSTDQYFTFQYG